jgi:hypothetical protein
MTSINLLYVSAPGCRRQGVFEIEGIQVRHDTLHTLHVDEISSGPKDRERRLYTYSVQNTI